MDGRKIYEFKISKNEIPELLTNPYLYLVLLLLLLKKKLQNHFPTMILILIVLSKKNLPRDLSRLKRGWRLTREPDPLVLSDGRAFIPDFVFEKYEKRSILKLLDSGLKSILRGNCKS